MIRYKVQFTHGNWIYLSEGQMELLQSYLHPQIAENTAFLVLDKEYPLMKLNEIQYIHREEMPTGSSTVIKAKTPTELREEKERKEQPQAPATLDEQLAKIE